VCSGPLLGL